MAGHDTGARDDTRLRHGSVTSRQDSARIWKPIHDRSDEDTRLVGRPWMPSHRRMLLGVSHAAQRTRTRCVQPLAASADTEV